MARKALRFLGNPQRKSMSDLERLALSYIGIRRLIGAIGLLFPIVIATGEILLNDPGLSGSVSGYYYSSMRNVFVGGLFAIGVFLLSYRYSKLEDRLGWLGCGFAWGVALFPTNSPGDEINTMTFFHFAFAGSLFVVFFLFCLVFAEYPSPPLIVSRRVLLSPVRRERLYLTCAGFIVVAVILSLLHLTPVPTISLFWSETIAIWAFGVAWLVRGAVTDEAEEKALEKAMTGPGDDLNGNPDAHGAAPEEWSGALPPLQTPDPTIRSARE